MASQNAGFSNGFSGDFGPPTYASGVRYQNMMVLAYSTGGGYNIYWDYGNTENFYVLVVPSDFGGDFGPDFGPPGSQLYSVSPAQASGAFAFAGNVTYNPFGAQFSNTFPISTIVQQGYN